MAIDPTLFQLFQSFATLGVVTFLVNIIAPFLERYAPFAKPGSSTHDATLRAVNLLLNVGLALGAAFWLNQLTNGQQILAVVGIGIAQATGSHVLYTSGNRNSSATPASMPSASAAPAPTTPASAAPVDVAAVAASSAARVVSAVDAAIAAQKPAA